MSRKDKVGATISVKQNRRLASGILLLLTSVLLGGCSSGVTDPPKADNPLDKSIGKEHSAPISNVAKKDESNRNDDLSHPGNSEVSSPQLGKPNKKAQLTSIAGRKTGVMEDAVIVQQQTEFLGPITLKLGKAGIRIESSSLSVILPAGKDPMAYNALNGNCLKVSAKSKTLLSGENALSISGKETSKIIGSEKVDGLACTHYKIRKQILSRETKKESYTLESDLWATKEFTLPKGVMNGCATLMMMPADCGVPVKILSRFDMSGADPGTRNPGGGTAGANAGSGALGGAGTAGSAQTSPGSKSPAERDHVLLTTKSFTRAKVDRGEFAYLSGFKTVTDEMKLIMLSDDNDNDGTDLDELDKK